MNIKYSPKQQNARSVDLFLEDNSTFKRGRTDTHKQVECPHCGIIGSCGAMTLNHFDNCPILTGKKKTFKMATVTCPHCGTIGAGSGMKRFHFNNCKKKNTDETFSEFNKEKDMKKQQADIATKGDDTTAGDSVKDKTFFIKSTIDQVSMAKELSQ